MENRAMRFNGRVIVILSVVAVFVLALAAMHQFNRAEALENAVENQYVHAFHELTDYVRDVDVLLKKTMLVTGAQQMSALSSEIFMQTAAAKASLAQLPVAELDLSGTSKFLSQVGDYTSSLAAKVINNGEISTEEYQTLSRLSDYAEAVSERLGELENQLNEQSLSFSEAAGMIAYAADGGGFSGGMEDLENALQDYPSLIYDGPFSEHLVTREAAFLTDKSEMTQEEALEAAKRFLGDGRAEKLSSD